ncbi:MAG: hypothetical protein U9R25_10975 [Chloroflexota bacterium]|nr:hypothetical protein [Chloroflexota bacterium]
MAKLMPGAEPFFYPGNDVGCLLIHGFTASAQEVHGLGRYLASQGLTVRGLLLPGHGTHPDDMLNADWRMWYAAVRIGYEDLRRRCDQVFAMGLSERPL